jgi:CBS domain containing-hemolysin-like protein
MPPETGLIILLIFVTVILLLLSALFSSAETAYTSINIIKIRNLLNNLKRKKNSSLQLVYKLISRYNELLMTILVFNTIINVVLAIFSS